MWLTVLPAQDTVQINPHATSRHVNDPRGRRSLTSTNSRCKGRRTTSRATRKGLTHSAFKDAQTNVATLILRAGQVNDGFKVCTALIRGRIGGAHDLGSFGRISGREDNVLEFLFARKRDNRVRVRHIHEYSAQGPLNARDRHVNVGRSTGSSWSHVNAVQDLGLVPLIDNADSANSPSGAHLDFLIGHEAFATQMINKNADAVATHFRDRPVGIAVVHEPATVLHDGTHQPISADTERR